ncbi:LacI family DNA-binding transcriptional regulator [Microbacterium oleivorans]|uniref:LacI family DNA-binding transcriptional regulator n=1 Tax=Microbacterium oleivorans TaxID=273677 RepID=UPI00203C3B2B|nr:LacI family DNA-binding transcriptional regulator [Microbacterium oleivorans]MCM3695096.1 LacI family transcriptional regulator [Microbacterium oleivorans]
MATKAATLQHVAELAGVSVGTASRALTGRGRVAEETRRRVREAAESLAFSPNSGASNLRKARAGTIGLWLPPSLRFMDFYMNFAFGVVEAADEQELSVSLVPQSLSPARARGLHVDGFVMSDVVGGDPLARAILASGKPVVTSERVPDGMPAPTASLSGDHVGATHDILERLQRAGARSAVVLVPEISQTWALEVREGAARWQQPDGMQVSVTLLTSFPSAAELQAIVARALDSVEDVDAFVCAADGLALGVLSALQELGRSVPDDIQLVSYTDSAAMPIVLPPIAALDLRPHEAGLRAARRLVHALEAARSGALPGETTVEPFELEFRPRASLRAD